MRRPLCQSETSGDGAGVERGDGLAMAAAALGPLLLYAITLPRGVVLEDDGLFLMAGAELGIAHPPGYPLYTLICHLFMQLPFGGPALLGHLSSAVLGALACGAVYVCARLSGAWKLPALTGAWLFAASEHVWSQAIIAEVYTLNALLFFAAYALVLRGVREPWRTWPWVAAAAAYGLSLANHWPLMALALPGLALAAVAAGPARPTRKALLPKLPLLLAVASVSASLPYGWMVARSWQEPFISFYGPIADWDAFWHYLSRSGYAEIDANPIAGWGDRFAFIGWFGQQAFWQLTPLGLGLALLGLFALLRRRRFAETMAGALVFLGNSVGLLFLLEFEFDFHRIAIFRPYSLVCYGLLALWLAVGLTFALQRLPAGTVRFLGAPGRLHSAGIQAIAGLAGTGLVAWAVAMHWPLNNRADSDFTARYAQTMFALLPQNAMLLAFNDVPTGVLGYERFVAQRRGDIELLHLSGLVYGNRLYEPLLAEPRRREILRRHLAASERPIFYAADDADFPHDYGVRHHGFLKEAAKDIAPGTLQLAFAPAAAQYFEELLQRRPSDGWERFAQLTLLHRYGQFLGYVALAGDADLLQRTRRQRTLAEQSFSSLIGMAEVQLAYGDPSHWPQIGAWLGKAEPLLEASFERWRRARFHHLNGVLLGRQGHEEPAVQAFQRSFAIHPDPGNPSLSALKLHGIAPDH